MSWSWAIATCKGTSHVRDNTECQDTSRCIVAGPRSNTLVAVVSDGAGSASFGKQGSVLTCRTISECARHYLKSASDLPSDEEVWSWIDQVRDKISSAATKLQATPRDFSATLVAVISLRDTTMILHIGDGAAVINTQGQWLVPSWPAQGEYASTTFFITDDPAPDLRLTRLPYKADGVGVFSDGIERLVLGFSDKTVSAKFFDKFSATVRNAGHSGNHPFLSASLKQYLNSPTVCERTDDDKSLIIAVRQ